MKGVCEEVCEEGREDGKTGSTHLQLGRDINNPCLPGSCSLHPKITIQFPSVDHLLAFKERSHCMTTHAAQTREVDGVAGTPNTIAAARSAAGEDARRLGAAVGRALRRIDPAMNQLTDGPRRRTKKRERLWRWKESKCWNTATDVRGRDRRRSNDSPSVTSEPDHPFSVRCTFRATTHPAPWNPRSDFAREPRLFVARCPNKHIRAVWTPPRCCRVASVDHLLKPVKHRTGAGFVSLF
jgi:hypothetical protein